MDFDDLYMEYTELVELGEIDPEKVSADDYVMDRYSDLAAMAYDRAKDALKDRGIP